MPSIIYPYFTKARKIGYFPLKQIITQVRAASKLPTRKKGFLP
jgi:hypothetical protein